MFAPQLRAFRLDQALSQEELAERAGVARTTIARAEHGKPIRPSSMRKFAKALGVTPRQLQRAETAGD